MGSDIQLPLSTPTRGNVLPVVKWGLLVCSCTGRESALEVVS